MAVMGIFPVETDFGAVTLTLHLFLRFIPIFVSVSELETNNRLLYCTRYDFRNKKEVSSS
jgi:hypothetical protein